VPRTAAFLAPWQVAEQGPDGSDRLLGYLPRWLQGPLATALARAVGRQLDALNGLGVDDQLFVATATWGLAWDAPNPDGTATATGWERDYGLVVQADDSYAVRRARVLGRMQGHVPRTLAEFAAYVAALLLPIAGSPYFGPSGGGVVTYSTYGKWVIFKPVNRGFPANFLDVEAALALAGPAHLGLWLAPHRQAPDTGLTDSELDLMHGEAIDVLLDSEIDGT
jgi:hypothetical protein